jgi:hypothetical protein
LSSFYPNEEFNLEELIRKDYQAIDLDGLFNRLEEVGELDSIDDSNVLNYASPSKPDEVNVEYVLIHDDDGNEIYRDEDYIR